MDRSSIQQQAADKLFLDRRLLCQWATGMGKSNVVLRFLREHPMPCLILVPEQNNISNWEDEFRKFDVPMEGVAIICYASLHKYEHTHWGLLVFDEAPHADTEKRKRICESIKADYVLALGAVIDEDEKTALEQNYGKFNISVYTLGSAIRFGLLPSPVVVVCHIALDDTVHRHWYARRQLTDKQMYDVFQRKTETAVANYNSSATRFNKQRMLLAGNERKRFLGSLKESAVRRICNYLESKQVRFLCFCSSIAQAESLGGEKAFTSKTPTSAKLLEKFNNHEIDSLYAVGKLIEGQNLNDIQHGIITQLGGTSRITVQSIGRIMRSKNPVIWIPVFDGTKDDSFLYTLTSNIPDDYIKHCKF